MAQRRIQGGGYGEINKSPHGQIPQYASRK